MSEEKKYIKGGALWKNDGEGSHIASGEFRVKIYVHENKFKDSDKHPDYTFSVTDISSPRKDGKASRPPKDSKSAF